jgi:hypothetical protein
MRQGWGHGDLGREIIVQEQLRFFVSLFTNGALLF